MWDLFNKFIDVQQKVEFHSIRTTLCSVIRKQYAQIEAKK